MPLTLKYTKKEKLKNIAIIFATAFFGITIFFVSGIHSAFAVAVPSSFILSHEDPICDPISPVGPAIRINWKPSVGATSYTVYRNGFIYTNVLGTDLTFYNNANVIAGQTYKYYVQARNSAGFTNSNTVSVTVRGDICLMQGQSCIDGIKNQNETDVDCGGSCSSCVNGKSCNISNDCQSNSCVNGVCKEFSSGTYDISVSDSPDPFNPSLGETNTITITNIGTNPCGEVSLSIENTGRSWLWNHLNSGNSLQAVWNGKNHDSFIVPAGIYNYTASCKQEQLVLSDFNKIASFVIPIANAYFSVTKTGTITVTNNSGSSGGGGGGTIGSYIKLLSPNGGENWKAGETHAIQWISQELDIGNDIAIELLPSSGIVPPPLFLNLPNNANFVDWTIPENILPGEYRVSIIYITHDGVEYSEKNHDMSDGAFNIIKGNTDPVVGNDFSFVHMTDVHLGRNRFEWYEETSYPRFTDSLYEIGYEYNTKLGLLKRPDFILISGDNVDYSDKRWLADFKSITDDFTARTGIKIYIVPGNHDRRESDTSGNDDLAKYNTYIKSPKENNDVTFLFNNLAGDTISGDGGYNKFNYYFDYKDIRFIGLDSGEDTGITNDWSPLAPESTGISNEVMNSLINMDPNIPKIIFMHSPVFTNTNGIYPSEGNAYENESIKNNRFQFIQYVNNKVNLSCIDNNVLAVLSGHTHRDAIHNWNGVLFTGSSLQGPIFVQTKSDTRDNLIDENTEFNHGYRIIDVKNGVVVPRASENTGSYEKIIVDMDQNDDNNNLINFKVYENRETSSLYFQNNVDLSYFSANTSENDSDRVILYKYDNNVSKLSVNNAFTKNDKYDLFVSRNEGDFVQLSSNTLLNNYVGFKVKNAEYCDTVSDLRLNGKFGRTKTRNYGIL